MEQFFIDYIDRLRLLHDEIKTAVSGLSTAALDWSPGPEINSITVLVTHAMGAERFWIGDVAVGQPSGRVRADEFKVNNLEVSDLLNLLDSTLAYVEGTLPSLSLAVLDRLRNRPNLDRQFSVGWCLLHTLEHTAVHTGHIQLMRQLWDQR